MSDGNTQRLLRGAERERRASRFKQAGRLFERAAAGSTNPVLRVQAWSGAADCARLLGDFPAALADYGRALKVAPRDDAALRADLGCGLALALRGAGEPLKAVRGLKTALAAYVRLNDAQGQAFCLWALGGAWRIAGRLPEALACLKQAEKAHQKLGDEEGLSYTYCALGGVHRMRGHLELSRAYYTKANTSMRQRRDLFGTAYSFCGLGNAARMLGDLKTAHGFFARAERAYARIGDRVSYAYTIWSMATAYKTSGETRRARSGFLRARALFCSTKDRRGLAYVFLGLAELTLMEGRPGAARALLKDASQLARGFAWEARHVRALKAILEGRPDMAGEAYADSGSRFRPGALPIAWP